MSDMNGGRKKVLKSSFDKDYKELEDRFKIQNHLPDWDKNLKYVVCNSASFGYFFPASLSHQPPALALTTAYAASAAQRIAHPSGTSASSRSCF